MDKRKLDSKWELTSSFKDKKGFKALRISAECVPDLFLATDEDGHRCLLLFLPTQTDITFKVADKEKLKLEYIQAQNIIIIRLKDTDFIDVFNDLILSLYLKIMMISDPVEYSHELIRAFYKWAEFFHDRLDKKLSLNQIKGLFGELFVLNELITVSDTNSIDNILESWKGPYDLANDFIFEQKNLEVKTKNISEIKVSISSAFQLEKEPDKGLELIVVSVQLDLSKGKSIHDLLKKIVSEIRKKYGDLSILYKVLDQKGLTVDNSMEYNNHRFLVKKTQTFDCTVKGFPKLVTSNIPEAINDVEYALTVSSLDSYLIEVKDY